MKNNVVEIGEAIVRSVILHQVGNRLREEALFLADDCFDITDNIASVLLAGYLRGIIGSKNQFVLSHEDDITLNDVAHHVSNFFIDKVSFVELSKKLARHLYASTHHPNIASGDLFIILFDRIKVNGDYKAAIGIYKSEAKQQYLSTKIDGEEQKLEMSSGINPDLIDKGALIIDGTEIIYAIDRLSSRTKYWIQDFLNAKQIPNEATKSTLAAGLIETIHKKIEDPVTQQEFSREIVELCSNKNRVIGSDIEDLSKKYVSNDTWSTELNRIIESKGLLHSDELNMSSKKLRAKLKKSLNHIDLGQNIALTIPEGLFFSDVKFKADGKKIIINLVLESENG